MTKILFSLPVHERPDIVRDQIENINYFAPDSLIVIHVSADPAVEKDEFRRHCEFDNVLINPKSYETVWSGGIMHTHVSNFLHALEQNAEFDRVVMISSNELLVKPGIADYVAKFEAGAQTEIFDLQTDWGVFKKTRLESDDMQGFLKALDIPLFFGGQAEGQFFSHRMFTQVARHFMDHFPMSPIGFPIEEVVPATVAARHGIVGTNIALPITLCDYCTNLKIDEEVIDRVRLGTGAFYARRIPKALRSPHIGASVLKGIFSVKRIPREDCEMRRYVRSLMI